VIRERPVLAVSYWRRLPHQLRAVRVVEKDIAILNTEVAARRNVSHVAEVDLPFPVDVHGAKMDDAHALLVVLAARKAATNARDYVPDIGDGPALGQ
jgi:hypothetical protein